MFPPSENSASSKTGAAADPDQPEFSREERCILLQLAHDSIAAAAHGRRFSPAAPSSHLAEPRGAFTTIYLHGELRGCVGYPSAVAPLYRTVADTAQAAAFEDTRFPALRAEEISELEVSLSVLSALTPVMPEQIEVGRHGLVVSLSNHRGLLLPQVPVEHGWDRTRFLEQTCRKAGLPTDAWEHGAKLEAFTAEIFGDREV
jgi:AmmeMemoRadiSam system protein A